VLGGDQFERRHVDAGQHDRGGPAPAAAPGVAGVDQQQPADGEIAVDIGERGVGEALGRSRRRPVEERISRQIIAREIDAGSTEVRWIRICVSASSPAAEVRSTRASPVRT
jgi:hypothetical protein